MSASIQYAKLPTEQSNPRSARIDRLSSIQALRLINQEDKKVALAVQRALPQIGKAVDEIVRCLNNGGRLFFFGAGTSGRLGVLEAAECPPTFNTPPSLVQAFMAGGRSSVFRSKEGAEDRGPDAERLVRARVKKGDVVVGIAASGVTAFVRHALVTARGKGARTILVTCHNRPPSVAHVIISLRTGPEVITGSTRLKAGTATKLALNSLTVASMVRLGKVYGNWMVDLQPRSKKLEARAVRLIEKFGRVPVKRAAQLLRLSGGNAKTAIVMARKNADRITARRRLLGAGGRLHVALR